jgi:hypothetical protein
MNNNRHINYTYSVEHDTTYLKLSYAFTCMLHVSALSQAIIRHVNTMGWLPCRKQQAYFAQNPSDTTWMCRNV